MGAENLAMGATDGSLGAVVRHFVVTESPQSGAPPLSPLRDAKLDFVNPGARERERLLSVLLVLFFCLVFLLGSPFQYARGGGGRYLLSVVKAADPSLFPDDPVVESLGRFRSGFYELLAAAFHLSGAPPERIEPTLRVLYVVSKVAMVLALFFLAATLATDLWVFVLLAAWAAHQKPVPVGGVSLFLPTVTHTEIALVLGLFAVFFLLRERPLFFWLLLSLSVFLHSLVAFHLFLAVVPAALLLERRLTRENAAGLLLFSAASILYLLFMAPPSLSDQEKRIFLAAKGEMQHVSPLNQGLVGWSLMLATVALAYLAYRQLLRPERRSRLLAGFVLSGTFFGVLLSSAALATRSARLALFQPMRIFFWVTLFAHILLALATVRALSRSLPVGAVLLGVFALSILDSWWRLAFLLLGTASFAAFEAPFFRNVTPARREWLVKAALAATVVVMLLAWGLGERQPFESFRDPMPAIAGFFLLGVIYGSGRGTAARWLFLGACVAYALVGASVSRHIGFAERADRDWDVVRRWCAANTEKSASFVTPPDGDNFRILSWRRSVSERVSALAWVDPLLFRENAEYADRIERAYESAAWDPGPLMALAREQGARYVVFKESIPPALPVLFRSGTYSVAELPDGNTLKPFPRKERAPRQSPRL